MAACCCQPVSRSPTDSSSRIVQASTSWRRGGIEHDVAEWLVEVVAAGRYQVAVTLAADDASAGDRFVVEAERSRASGLVRSSGGYETFHEYAIGIDRAGGGSEPDRDASGWPASAGAGRRAVASAGATVTLARKPACSALRERRRQRRCRAMGPWRSPRRWRRGTRTCLSKTSSVWASSGTCHSIAANTTSAKRRRARRRPSRVAFDWISGKWLVCAAAAADVSLVMSALPEEPDSNGRRSKAADMYMR